MPAEAVEDHQRRFCRGEAIGRTEPSWPMASVRAIARFLAGRSLVVNLAAFIRAAVTPRPSCMSARF
jgi:hypothetical protein